MSFLNIAQVPPLLGEKFPPESASLSKDQIEQTALGTSLLCIINCSQSKSNFKPDRHKNCQFLAVKTKCLYSKCTLSYIIVFEQMKSKHKTEKNN